MIRAGPMGDTIKIRLGWKYDAPIRGHRPGAQRNARTAFPVPIRVSGVADNIVRLIAQFILDGTLLKTQQGEREGEGEGGQEAEVRWRPAWTWQGARTGRQEPRQ